MSKIVIVPEPHIFDKTFKTRNNYPQEIKTYLDQVFQIAREQAKSDKVYIIFMGDVFHMGFSRMVPFVNIIDTFQTLSREFEGRVYSLIGNHELSYPSNNPFWLLADFKSKWYKNYRTIPGFQSAACVKVCDELQVDDTLFVFGHYRRDKFEYDWSQYGDVHFLTHNSIMDNEIVNVIKNNFGRDPKMEYASGITSIRQAGSIPLTSKLSHMYVGHMHTAFSRFFVDERINDIDLKFELRYLGSLGRTNHAEVNNEDLTRVIPIVDTVTHQVAYPEIQLLPREVCIREDAVIKGQEQYQRTKVITKLRKDNIRFGSPIEGIRDWLSQSPADLDIFNQLISNAPLAELDNLLLLSADSTE